MKKILLSLLLAVQAFGQYPQVTTQGPQRPTMQVGSSLSNIGTVTAYTGVGAPGTVVGSVVGDIYVDTGGHLVYTCTTGNNPCTAWQNASAGELIPVTAFGVNGNASTDPGNFSNALILTESSGICLFIPNGVTVNLSTATGTPPGLTSGQCLRGSGPGSIVRGSSSLPSFAAVLAISGGATNVELGNFTIEGGCTSPVGVLYSSALSNGPNWVNFITGSSIINNGNGGISIHDVTINHTCGYAIYNFNGSSTMSNVNIRRVSVTNSRPFLFGNNPSFEVYGSWTGGILFLSSGSSTGFSNITVDSCLFQNVVGNALWTHVLAPGFLSNNVAFTNNTCVDTGLDCIQVAGLDGYVETGNKSLRNGYVITSDIGASRVGGPAWLQGFNPVSFDTAYKVINAIRNDNVAEAENGEGFDLDGIGLSVVSNNKVTSCFSSTDPLSNAAACGPYNSPSSPLCPGAGSCTGSGTGVNNFTRGILSANTLNINDGAVGYSVAITGNVFDTVGGGGVQVFAAHNFIIANNVITQPTTSSYSNPITLGNIGTSGFQHSNGNLVSNNTVVWSPASGSPAVFEDSTSVGACAVTPFCPFFSTDVNIVRNTNLVGTNLFEFTKGTPDASGTGALSLSSVTPGAGVVTATVLQTEGPTANPSLRLYANNGFGTLMGGFNVGGFQPIKYLFANLPLAVAFPGSVIFCTDCSAASPCTGSGNGRLAVSNGGTWSCN